MSLGVVNQQWRNFLPSWTFLLCEPHIQSSFKENGGSLWNGDCSANVLSAAVAAVCDACCANLINVEEADGDNDSDHIPKINEPWGADNHNNDGDNGGAAVDSGGEDSDNDGDW